MIDIAILGAGPAGMTAALQAANSGAHPLLIDSNPTPGRKLLVTGAGRCNLSNAHADPARYSCANPTWMQQVLALFGHADLMSLLKDLGVLCEETADGWTYPRSGSAATVQAAFISNLEQRRVTLRMNTRISGITHKDHQFTLTTPAGPLICRHLIAAWGGKARPELGGDGVLFPALQKMGHTVLRLAPALAPLRVELGAFRDLQGVRMDVHANLFEKDKLLAETSGNLIVTEWGFNGPAVMDLSHHVSGDPGKSLRLELNLLPNALPELFELLESKYGQSFPLAVLLGALLPPKVTSLLLRMSDLPLNARMDVLKRKDVQKLLELAQHISFPVLGVRDYRYCQLKTGGVPITETDATSMASLIVPGLFLVGEVLDVVGPCGGYNLLFAFASGSLAGKGVVDSNDTRPTER
jgi:predicted Rossmann fold flavoprotein